MLNVYFTNGNGNELILNIENDIENELEKVILELFIDKKLILLKEEGLITYFGDAIFKKKGHVTYVLKSEISIDFLEEIFSSKNMFSKDELKQFKKNKFHISDIRLIKKLHFTCLEIKFNNKVNFTNVSKKLGNALYKFEPKIDVIIDTMYVKRNMNSSLMIKIKNHNNKYDVKNILANMRDVFEDAFQDAILVNLDKLDKEKLKPMYSTVTHRHNKSIN